MHFKITIDNEKMDPAVDARTHCIGNRPPVVVSGLPNVQHTLKVDFPDSSGVLVRGQQLARSYLLTGDGN